MGIWDAAFGIACGDVSRRDAEVAEVDLACGLGLREW